MKTLSVSISENDYQRYGIKDEKLSFTDVIDLVSKLQFKEHLAKSVELAEKYGLSTMTMEEITDEVKAVRNGKTRH